MIEATRHSAVAVPGATQRLYRILFPVPIVCFLGALLTDIAYASSAYLMWMHFAEWMIAAGLAVGALAAVVLLIEFAASRAMRTASRGWTHMACFYACLVVELINALVHTIDGWTAVVPMGMTLSVIGTVLALAAGVTLGRIPAMRVVYEGVQP